MTMPENTMPLLPPVSPLLHAASLLAFWAGMLHTQRSRVQFVPRWEEEALRMEGFEPVPWPLDPRAHYDHEAFILDTANTWQAGALVLAGWSQTQPDLGVAEAMHRIGLACTALQFEDRDTEYSGIEFGVTPVLDLVQGRWGDEHGVWVNLNDSNGESDTWRLEAKCGTVWLTEATAAQALDELQRRRPLPSLK